MQTVAKLTCPECRAVLKPPTPVPVGKKVKCPKCQFLFVAEGPEDEPGIPLAEDGPIGLVDDDPPAKKAKPGKGAKPKKAVVDDEDDGPMTYGTVKDEEDDKKKPKIDYAPDTSIKDLR